MAVDSKYIVKKLLQYFYGDYTYLSEEDDGACPDMSML
jgi:hypothetical protein